MIEYRWHHESEPWPTKLLPADEDAACRALIRWLISQNLPPCDSVPVLMRLLLQAIKEVGNDNDGRLKLIDYVCRVMRETAKHEWRP